MNLNFSGYFAKYLMSYGDYISFLVKKIPADWLVENNKVKKIFSLVCCTAAQKAVLTTSRYNEADDWFTK